VYYYERRNDQGRYGNDYRGDHRNYQYQGYQGDQGYRGYQGYQGYQGYRSYGGNDGRGNYGVVRSGRCNTDGALTVMGAVTGGIIGSRSASRGNRDVSTVVGALAGGILGNAIGSSIDQGNRACSGY
jgi:hypothetical protein